MSSKIVLIIFLIVVIFPAKERAMNEHTRRRIENFKDKIGYDAAEASVDSTKSVVFRYLSPKEWNTVKSFKNNIPVYDKTFIYNNGILKELRFDTGENNLYVNMYIYRLGHKSAMDGLLNDALSTTMKVNPYNVCPYGLGDINISVIGSDSYHISWSYYNVFFSVNYNGIKIDIEQFCRELQKYTEGFVVDDIEHYRPQFKEVIVSSNQIKKGETVSIEIIPAYGEAFKGQKKNSNANFSLNKIWNADVLDLVDYTDFSFKFKGIAEGTETITFILADMDALVCSKHEVTISVSK